MSLMTKRRILIVDDQESIHQDYRKIITPPAVESAELEKVEEDLFGSAAPLDDREWDLYEIDSAFQGEEAVTLVQRAMAEGRPYAVAFVDIRMPPGCDGIQTIRRMWEFDAELLVVICSAYSDYCWEDIVHELGRTDRFLILRKPFENIEVRQCAAALTERWVISRTDVLTGLLNRRSFQEQLNREWAHSVRHQQPLCCVMLDVDYFKSINDRFGHAAGDRVLKAIADRIVGKRRPSDSICRYGGEEICVLMPNTGEEDGFRWSESLRQELAESPVQIDQDLLRLTASFGVSASNGGTLSEKQLLEQADAALRQAKQAGRDRVIRWTSVNGNSRDLQKTLESEAPFENIRAREIMTVPVAAIRQDATIAKAAEILLQCRLNCAPVVDSDGRLLGVISEKDIMEAIGTESGWSAPVSDLMTTRVIQYEPDTSAQVIFDFFCRVQLRRVMIVEEERPVGVISRGSFLRWIQNYLKSKETSDATFDSRYHLFKTAESLMSHTMKLCDELEACTDDVVQPVVCGVSSIEMLLGDLLMWAGSSNTKPEGEKLAECL